MLEMVEECLNLPLSFIPSSEDCFGIATVGAVVPKAVQTQIGNLVLP